MNFDEYFRCYVVGQEKVRVCVRSEKPHHERYLNDPPPVEPPGRVGCENDA